MFDRDPSSGLWMPRRLRPLKIFAATHLIGFGVGASAPLVPATWNPADKNAGITLSNSDRTESGAANITLRSTAGKSSGKWMMEITLDSGTSRLLGLGNSSASLSQYPGQNTNSWAYYTNGQKYTNNSGSAYGNSFTNGDVISIAWDADNGKLYFAKNGTWQNSGDPAAGTNAAFTGLTGPLYVMAGGDGGTTQCTGNWGQAAFTATLPSGFAAWTV